MDNLKELLQIDWQYVLIAIVLLLACIKAIWSLIDWLLFGKLGIETKKMKQKRHESELLKTTAELAKVTGENLAKLQERQSQNEEEFKQALSNYIDESQKDRKALHDEMMTFTNNRTRDRQQSLQIQQELKDSIALRDVRIDSLVLANKEMLAEKINEKYKYYISIQGIPADEYDEFTSLHQAYNGLGGNHHGDAKFQYCMKHLPIIPVETNLTIKRNKDWGGD